MRKYIPLAVLLGVLLIIALASMAHQQGNQSIGGTFSSPTITTPTVTGGTFTTPTINGLTNGTGLQAFNTATTCTTAATISTPCTTAAISLPVGYADTNYRLVCTPLGPTNFPQLQTVTKSNTTFTITLNNLTAAAATYSSYDCVAHHN